MRTTTCTLQVQQSNGPTPSTEHYKLMVALCTHLSCWHNLCQSWVYHNLEICMKTYYTRVHLRHFPSLHEWKGNSDWDWVWCNLLQKRYCDNVDCFSFLFIQHYSLLSSRLTAFTCDSTQLLVFSISIEVVYLQRWHGWCHMKLLPSRRKFRIHHTTMYHVTSCNATYVRCMRV